MTPLENPEVNGPWICNKGRDLAQIFERPRATQAMQKGKPVDLAYGASRPPGASSKAPMRPVALVSSWGSNEELDAFKQALAGTLHRVRQAGLACRSRASGSTTIC